MNLNYFMIAMKSIRRRKLRSLLTILGIIIGIALIVTTASLGEGMKGAVLKQLRSFGTDLVWVMPGKGNTAFLATLGGLRLTKADDKAIGKISEIKDTCPMALKTFIFDYRKDRVPVLVCAHPERCNDILKESQAWSLHSGKFFKDGEKDLLIGYTIAMNFFDKELKPNHRLYINGTAFTVVGIMTSLGMGEMGDSFAFMPLDAYRDFTGDNEGVDSILVQVKQQADVGETAEQIKAELRKLRDVDEDAEDFSVVTNTQAALTVGNVIGIIELVLLGITAFALVIGGIGVMNTMYTSIYEKTKDIGIMKAVGAKEREIMAVFLIESGLLGLTGGVLGVIIGFSIAVVISAFSPLVTAYYGAELIAGALVFSFLIGLAAGYMPARRAAQLDPIEALRHE